MSFGSIQVAVERCAECCDVEVHPHAADHEGAALVVLAWTGGRWSEEAVQNDEDAGTLQRM